MQHPFHIVLFRPQIPPNTGSIARTCAATGAKLHLVGPMGFSIDDKQVKRAGLDYWPHVVKEYYPTWEDYCSSVRNDGVRRMHVFSSKATENFWDAEFAQGDTLLFGREDKGLPVDLAFPENIEVRRWRVPIRREFVRSLNLSVCVGVVLFEAFRQIGVEPRDVLRGGELTIDKV